MAQKSLPRIPPPTNEVSGSGGDAGKASDNPDVVPSQNKGIGKEQNDNSKSNPTNTVNGPSAGDILKEKRGAVAPTLPSPPHISTPPPVKYDGNKLGTIGGKKGNNTQKTRDDTPPKPTWAIIPGGANRTD